MSSSDIKLLRDNGICVVVCKDPAKVKFLDPIPSVSDRSTIEVAAIKMSRLLLNRCWGDISTSSVLDHGDFAKLFVSCLVTGTPLDRNGTPEEKLAEQARWAKIEEVRKIAREEARAERKVQKEALSKSSATETKAA